MKRKIIISSFNLDYGGIEKALINLLNNIDLNKYDITLVLEEKKGIFLEKINQQIKIIQYQPNNNKFILLRKFFNLLKKIKWIIYNKNHYDVSICYATYSLSSNFISRVSAKKRIFYVHSNYYEMFEHDINKTKEFFNMRYLDRYNKIVFVSNESKDDFINVYPDYKSSCVVINNIVDIEEIKIKAKEKCDLPINNKYIGIFIGRLEESVKRVNLIVETAKKCQDNNKDIGFIIVGDGKDKEHIKSLINSYWLNNIKLLGAQSNPYKYLVNSDFLILTSKYEGYPVVYNEAIVLEKPILTTLNITDDEITINNRFGIITSSNLLYDNLDNIIKFKNEKIDFAKVNKKRKQKIEELIEEVYEE